MANGVTFTVKFDKSAEAYEKLHKGVVDAVVDTAKDVKSDGQARCPVDTGYMQSTYYVDAEGYSDYGQGVKAAPKGASLLPAESHEKDTQAIIGIAASYGIFPELGTAHAPAQPSLTPAAEQARAKLLSRLSRLDEVLK